MQPDSWWSKATFFLTNNPAAHKFHAWMMEQPMLAQMLEWMSVLNQHRWGFIVLIMVVAFVLRFISPFFVIFRLLWTTAMRLLIAIVVHTIVVPVNRFTAWLSRPRPQRYARQAPPPRPGSDETRQ
jgi:TRAP-type mannitol/chloroaromatic compound transport system permease large subunit